VEATDAVRHRFGERAITRARLVGSRLPAPFEHDPMTAADARGGHRSPGPADAAESTDVDLERDSLDDTANADDGVDNA
jgi:hypothetical protein